MLLYCSAVVGVDVVAVAVDFDNGVDVVYR